MSDELRIVVSDRLGLCLRQRRALCNDVLVVVDSFYEFDLCPRTVSNDLSYGRLSRYVGQCTKCIALMCPDGSIGYRELKGFDEFTRPI